MLKTSRKMINHLCGFWVDNIWQLSSLQIMLGGTFESFECGGCHPQIGTKIVRFIWGNYYIDSWLKSWFLVNPQNRPGFIHLKLTPFFLLQINHGFMSDWMVARRPQKFQWESTRNACFLPEMVSGNAAKRNLEDAAAFPQPCWLLLNLDISTPTI